MDKTGKIAPRLPIIGGALVHEIRVRKVVTIRLACFCDCDQCASVSPQHGRNLEARVALSARGKGNARKVVCIPPCVPMQTPEPLPHINPVFVSIRKVMLSHVLAFSVTFVCREKRIPSQNQLSFCTGSSNDIQRTDFASTLILLLLSSLGQKVTEFNPVLQRHQS
eukprot:CAMPEP_0180417950 /NCGR_PEP_ID=MMETSP1036_2-20121128/1302_1 /TAXON_ID=632150 /ORGANISM="Azadinium spinosum, Strain 3D9" /LENGTH=165 /DNA_ID=CAMNT_0022423005 /DNA_START=504 /DNA_END=1002 /DNA_ORIENTATION=+